MFHVEPHQGAGIAMGNTDSMSIKIALRRNGDGVVRVVDDEYSDGWYGPNGGEFIWTEGNYACDCNRNLFFARAGNEPEPESDVDCGETLYSIVYVELKDGTKIEPE